MHRFKIGQKVVAIRDHSIKRYRAGDIFTVDGLMCCCSCGVPTLQLVGLNQTVDSECSYCGACKIERQNYNEDNFAPLQNNTDACEYRMKVSIPELITIKEYQEQ